MITNYNQKIASCFGLLFKGGIKFWSYHNYLLYKNYFSSGSKIYLSAFQLLENNL
jgi:hypothetical protein